MSLLPRCSSLVRNIFRKKRVEHEIAEQLADHLRMLVYEKMSQGMNREEACRLARIEMGGIEQVKEEVRDALIGNLLDSLGKDLLYGTRVLAKKPLFSIFVLLTLAIGIGANGAIFSVVHTVLLQPLPYYRPDRLAMIWSEFRDAGVSRAPASGPELAEIRTRSRLFLEFAGTWVGNGALTGVGEPEEIKLGFVTANFFHVLGVNTSLGRNFLPEEEGTGAAHAMLLSHALWKSHYGSDQNIVGKTVRLEGQEYTVVGVMPPTLQVIFPPDANVPLDVQAWVPFPYTLAATPRDLSFLRVLGRLRDGSGIPDGQAELSSIAAQLRSQFKEFSKQNLDLHLVPLQSDAVRDVRPALVALFAAVSLVLLIACANVTNLVLSRLNERRKEITLRTALGASRARIVRQLLIENLLLYCLGGVASMAVSWTILKSLAAIWPDVAPRIRFAGLDSVGVGFVLLVSLGSGLMFGLAPAVGASKANLIGALNEGGRSITGGRQLFRNLLISSEVTLGLVLLIGAGLMIRTMSQLMQVDPGFKPHHTLTFQTALPTTRYPKDLDRSNFVQQLEKSLLGLPGVEAVGEASHLPFDDFPNWYSYYWPLQANERQQNTTMADYRAISPGFFHSVGVKIVAGRDFSDIDSITHHRVAIIDEFVAQQSWQNQNPIGQQLNVEYFTDGEFVRDWAEVVGVVKHLKLQSLTKTIRGQIYLPYAQSPRPWLAFTVHTTANPQTLIDPVRRAVSQMDKDLPVSKFQTMDQLIAHARIQTRFVTAMAAGFGSVALLLACIGIYGVTSYSVAQKTTEIGIRMSLGAQRRDILRLVLRQSMGFSIAGILLGLVLSLMLAPFLSSLLFGVAALDPTTFVGVSVFLLLISLLASSIPALRAAAISPMLALRCE